MALSVGELVEQVRRRSVLLAGNEALFVFVTLEDAGGSGEVLDEEERRRAERFRFERDRRRYVASHTALRWYLAGCLGGDPRELRLEAGPRGKPFVAAATGRGLEFNMSHTDGLAVLLVAPGRPVGVDVERVRAVPDAMEIAERHFCRAEVEQLRAVSRPHQAEAFFHCWTRKEAFIKAVGEGLEYPLDSFEVSLRPGEPGRLVRLGALSGDRSGFQLVDLPAPKGYVAAGVARDTEIAIERWVDFEHRGENR
jgi:4'-phosphopantetheinyl transferase